MTDSLFAALETVCRDSLESSVEQVREWPPGDQITDAMQVVIRGVDALRLIATTPEPLSNKNSALNQCAYLKELAAKAMAE